MNEEIRKKEIDRLYLMTEYERYYSNRGVICGVDEAGRGPLAGPVVAAAVILPKKFELFYLNDSKKLSEKKRELLFTQIKEQAVCYGVGIVDEKRIDEINILNATYEAMKTAIEALEISPDVSLNDAVIIPLVDVTCGMAAGSFAQASKDNSGGGMSAKMTPAAVLIIQNGVTKLVNVRNQDAISKILDMVPDLIHRFTGKDEVSVEATQKAEKMAEELKS